MKENKYDNIDFFNKYRQMQRSVEGLKGAGEWYAFESLLPGLKGKRVLDLGCGFGWHCRYAVEKGAKAVIGIDISERMLDEARRRTEAQAIKYIRMPMEDVNFEEGSFDVVISSLAFHYLESCKEIFQKVNTFLTAHGSFVFSVEHPVFTANEKQDWYHDEQGNIMHWPVDRYFEEGIRITGFLGEPVKKYHRTVASYINSLLETGFEIKGISEPEPDPKLLAASAEMKHELRRPMFLIIAAGKTD